MRVAKEDDSCGHQSHIHLQWRLGWFWECMKLYSMNSGVSKISTVTFLNSYKWDYKSYDWGYISLYILPFITVKGHNCILLSVCTCYVFLTNGRSDAEKTFFFHCQEKTKPKLGVPQDLGSTQVWDIIITGWWFGTFFIFPYIGNSTPIWLMFFRGVETTKQIITRNQACPGKWPVFKVDCFSGKVPQMSDFQLPCCQYPGALTWRCPIVFRYAKATNIYPTVTAHSFTLKPL